MLISPVMLFYEKLELALKQRGINPASLARRTKISESAISRYLKGDRTPSVKALISIADVLGISYEDIMSWLNSGVPDLKKETLDEKLMGYFKEMTEFEKEVYVDSLEKRSKAKKGATKNEENTSKPRKKVQETN